MSYIYKDKGWRDGTKVGAFKWADYAAMQLAVKELRTRAVSYLTVDLTSNDMLRLFVDPEHHEIVRGACTLLKLEPVRRFDTHVVTRDNELKKMRVMIEIRHQVESKWVAPGYIGHRLFNHPEAEAKVAQWVEDRVALGYEFSLVNEVLFTLNSLCPDENTVRFFWSGIIGLATVGNRDALANKVRECKPLKRIPALPPTLRDALESTQLTIVKAMMLPERTRNENTAEVELRLDINFITKPAPWGVSPMETM